MENKVLGPHPIGACVQRWGWDIDSRAFLQKLHGAARGVIGVCQLRGRNHLPFGGFHVDLHPAHQLGWNHQLAGGIQQHLLKVYNVSGLKVRHGLE